MKIEPILTYVRSLLAKAVMRDNIVVDATVGNGHDTVFLAKLVGKTGKVYGFDIQAQAIEQTMNRLETENLSGSVQLFQTGHEHVACYLPTEHHGQIAAAIFNLGYLPKGNKTIVTKPETTLSAIEQLLPLLKVGGILVLVVYHGHEGGAAERDALLEYVSALNQESFHVLQYAFLNQRNHPPFVLAIEKKRGQSPTTVMR
ncbi:class I SAM-dependent methyltransferase [Lederbergia galactosidilytica]|uniref:rRNA methyltransferase n=1 Tax=Lederbergia galactosidilytica TaxID=217031 RepID=A0A177ZMJ6_9BACI|nr:class I SAM-dependent methyltransferase [Lederbergia galactosidilytica]KRG16088.1 rRNA methyltransferase [Virgibacillus soli]MBP1915269.1 16S rRNA C1402 N4-methylase RsmH [Lederbergia galactosidilytica]OAK68098.1 rRNA methyltransferase [Lederbergia galactosidilytica]